MATDNFLKNIALSSDQITSSVYFSQMKKLQDDVYSSLGNVGAINSSSETNIILGHDNNVNKASVALADPGNILIGNALTHDANGNETVVNNANGAIVISNQPLVNTSVVLDGQLVICGNSAFRALPSLVPNRICISGYDNPAVIGALVPDTIFPININGSEYYIPLIFRP